MAHIVILGSAYPLRGGGLATFNERLARAFMQAGHRVTIYTFALQYPRLLFPGKSQYSDEKPPEDLDIRVRVNSINPLNWYKVGRELRNMKPDVLIIRYWLPFMAPCLGKIAAITKKNKHTRVVAIADNIIPHEKRPGDNLLTRYFVHKPHAYICMSEQVRSDLERFSVSPDRIKVCLHPLYDNFGEAVDREKARKHLGINEPEPLVLFFGFIREYKGLDLLLKAFSFEKLREIPVKLLIAGEFYTNPDPYYRLARELGIEERLIWHTGFIPNDEVKYYFCAADLIAQAYKSATQSGVTQVAYHFERPMVVTNVGGLPEIINHGKSGYVVNPDPGEIAGAIHDFFAHQRGKTMKDSLKEEKKRFSWEKFVRAALEMAYKDKHYGNQKANS